MSVGAYTTPAEQYGAVHCCSCHRLSVSARPGKRVCIRCKTWQTVSESGKTVAIADEGDAT